MSTMTYYPGEPKEYTFKEIIEVLNASGAVNAVEGLVAGTAAAESNTNVIQAALNSKGLIKIPEKLGTIYLSPGSQSNDYGILLVDDYTKLEIGAGTYLSQLPSPQVTTPLISNKYARSNKFAVTSITAGSQDPQGKYTIVTAVIPGNDFVAGQFILFKGDTSGFYNRVWEVQSVSGNNVVFHGMAYATFPNATGTLIAYHANAFITICGDGGISGAYNLTNGTIGYVNLCAVLFNKVRACAYRVRSLKSYQRGCQFVNFYDCEAGGGEQVISIESGAVGVQITGPGIGITVTKIYGGNADDKVAVLTYDVTGAQFYDADGTLNSGGNIDGVTIGELFDHGNSTRTVMTGADGGRLDNLKVYDIHRHHRGPGQGVEMEVLNGGVYGHTVLEDIELICHGKGGTLLGLTGAATSTNGGGVYEHIELIRPTMRAAPGTSFLGACETSLVFCGSNNWGNVKKMRVDAPSIHYDLSNSSNEVAVFGGGNTAQWSWENLEIISPEVTHSGTNGRVALFSVGLSNDLESSIRGGRIKTRQGYGFFVSSGRRYKIRLIDLTVTGMNDLLSGNGQITVDCMLCDFTGMGTGQDGALIHTYGVGTSGTPLEHNISTSQTRFGNTFVTGGLGAYTYIRYRSGGGNTCSQVTPFYNGVNNDGGLSNNNRYYLYGNCADWSVRLDRIIRNAGAIVQSNTSVGTIVATNLAVCDATDAANSWKQISNTTLVY